MLDAQFTVPPAPVLLSFGAALAVLGARRLRPRTPLRWATLAAAVVYAVAVADVTLFPMDVMLGKYGNQAAWYTQINPVPLVTADAQTFFLNVVMTVPLGTLLPLVTPLRRARDVAIVGLALSATIEALQLLLNIAASTGRGADVNDLVANTLGTALGFFALRVTAAAWSDSVGLRLRRPASTPAPARPAPGPRRASAGRPGRRGR